MPSLFFIIGPTAVGKSELTLRWAEAHDAEILYCDAFCVYRGMDIGTAKPSRAERSRVPHHGIDIADPCIPYSVADYVAEARRVVEDCTRRGKTLLVSGGSGFYARSFFFPVLDSTEVPHGVRQLVRAMSDSGGVEALVTALRRLNPAGVEGLDLLNPRRVQAALERCMATGKPLSQLQQEYRAMPEPYPEYEKHICLLSRSREDLLTRIQARARAMIEAGLIDEVRNLRGTGFEENHSAATAIGYREVLSWLDEGACSGVDALAEEIALNTRKLIKKQRTFFRTQIPRQKLIELAPGACPDIDSLF